MYICLSPVIHVQAHIPYNNLVGMAYKKRAHGTARVHSICKESVNTPEMNTQE